MKRTISGVAAWVLALAFFLPVLWMVVTAFKPESAAETWPPRFAFRPTLAEFRLVFSGMDPYLAHSAIATAGSTVLVLVLGVPAAYALSVHPVRRWRDGLFFFISTKMLPIVAAIGPLYVIALHAHLLDSIWLLIILYTAMNLPLAVWMIRSFMLEVPRETLEAARLDGAGRIREMSRVILPMISPGLVSTALICVIFAWNELFLAVNLTITNAATMPMFLISSVPQEGLYIAHLSAAATVASVPVVIVGWIAQRSLVRGLAMGAIKLSFRRGRPSQMRAVIIEKPGHISVQDVPEPVPAIGEVVVQVKACGICGTDLHIADGEFPPTPYPIIPGHEFAGLIADGNGSDLAAGTLVAVDPTLNCGHCEMCRAGRGNLCLNWNATGDTVNGAFAEYVAVPYRNVYRLPAGLSARQGALVEPASCAVHGMRRLGPVAGQSAVVYGAGTMGLLLTQLLLSEGASSVTVVDRIAERLAVAASLGADVSDDVSGGSDRRYDIAVDATGVPALIERGCAALRRGGRLLIFGVARDDAVVRLSPFRIYNDEITVIGSMAVLHSFDAAITAIASGAVATEPLLGAPFALDDFPAALAHVRAGKGIKTQVLPGG